jgi:histidine decarboxylase
VPSKPDQPATLPAADTVTAELDDLYARLSAADESIAGFPAANDIDFTPLNRFLRFRVINNLGDPASNGAYPLHTKQQERAAVDLLADLFRLLTGDRWGYIGSGATEGTEYALHLARTIYRNPHAKSIVYHSTATHHAVVGVAERLELPTIAIPTDDQGEIDYLDLADQIRMNRDSPAIVIANIGSAATEAIDDVRQIKRVLDAQGVTRRWIHADAALSGLPLAALDPAAHPGMDFADGADSIVVSGHKWLGTPIPSAAVLTRRSRHDALARSATYTGAADATIANSRSGLAALYMWYALRKLGVDGLRERARQSRELAAYAHGRLIELDLQVARLPHAITVTFAAPAAEITARWCLPAEHGRARIVAMPGMTREHIDRLVGDLQKPADLDTPAEIGSDGRDHAEGNDRRDHAEGGDPVPSSADGQVADDPVTLVPAQTRRSPFGVRPSRRAQQTAAAATAP